MSARTLLVGGPRDGEVLTVENEHAPIFVFRPEPMLATYVAEPGPVEYVMPQKETYYRETVAFFGHALRVHLHESLIGRQREANDVVAVHLLSESGKAVLVR